MRFVQKARKFNIDEIDGRIVRLLDPLYPDPFTLTLNDTLTRISEKLSMKCPPLLTLLSLLWNSLTCQYYEPLTFRRYSRICADILAPKILLSSQTVTREKMRKILLYKKGASKMLMKLTPTINFINVKCTCFLYELHFSSFF